MKVCKNCGAAYEDEVKFCPNCGTVTEVVEQPASQQVQQAEPEKKGGNAIPIVALVFSIFSVSCCCLDGFAWVASVAAIVLAIIALAKKKGSKGLAIASLVLGIIGFLLSGGLLLLAYVIIPNNPELQSAIMEMIESLEY